MINSTVCFTFFLQHSTDQFILLFVPVRALLLEILKPFKRVSVNLSVVRRVGRSCATSACPGPCCWLFGCAVRWWWPARPSAPAPDSCLHLSSLFLKTREKLYMKMVVEAKLTWAPPSGWMQYRQLRLVFFLIQLYKWDQEAHRQTKKVYKNKFSKDVYGDFYMEFTYLYNFWFNWWFNPVG